MIRYITLITFTEKGSAKLRQSTSRAHAFDAMAAESGVEVEGQYWTVGSYDGVLILRADEERKILHLLAALAEFGNVRPQSMRAFTDKEFDAIVNG